MLGLRGALLSGVIVFAAVACGPTQIAVKTTRQKFGWSQVDLRVHQLTPTNVSDYGQYALYGRHTTTGQPAAFARVPLPGFLLEMRNRGDDPIHLDRVKGWVTTDTGARWELLIDRAQIVERAVAQARKQIGKSAVVLAHPGGRSTLDAIAEAARTAPVFGAHDTSTEVLAHYTWYGAFVIAGDEAALAAFRQLDPTDRLVLHIEGVRTDNEEIPYSHLAFHAEPAIAPHEIECGDGRIVEKAISCGEPVGYSTALDGSCLQEKVVSAWVYSTPIIAPFLSGQAITTTDATQILLEDPQTRRAEVRGWRMRVAGWSLLAIGGFGAAATAASLGITGHSDKIPAGLGLLGASAIGIGLVVGSQHAHTQAVRKFNYVAWETGLCPRATKLRDNSNFKERPLNLTPWFFDGGMRNLGGSMTR